MLMSAQFYAEIPQIAAQSDLPEARLYRPPSYAQAPPFHGPWMHEPSGRFLPPMGGLDDMRYIGQGPRYPPVRVTNIGDRARSSSGSPPRGRPVRRHTQRGPGNLPRENRYYFDNDREAVRRARDRKLSSSSEEEMDEAQSDTMLQQQMSAAEKHIANKAKGEKELKSKNSTGDPGPSPQPQTIVEEPRLTHSPVSFDEENFSILPQRGSLIGTPAAKGTKDGSSFKRPVQYQKPSVAGQHP